jgi:hypothetical protein
MSESKTQEGTVSESIEVSPADTPFVVAGYGETAKREGAKTKDVYNVRFPHNLEGNNLVDINLTRPLLG